MTTGWRFLAFGLMLAVAVTTQVGCNDQVASKRAESQSGANAPISKDDLIAILRRRDFDRSITAFNQVKARRYQGDLLPLISSLWSGAGIQEQGLDRDFIFHPRIRAELADILVQAANNGQQGLPVGEIASFARSAVAGNDLDVMLEAVQILGELHDPQDVDTLVAIAINERDRQFQASVAALSFDCAVNQGVVAQLQSRLKSPENQKYLSEVWERSLKWRSEICKR